MSSVHLAAWNVDDPTPWCQASVDAVRRVFTPLISADDELYVFGSVLRILADAAPSGFWPRDIDVCVVSASRTTMDSELRAAATKVAAETGLGVDLFVLAPDAPSVDEIVRASGLRLA